MMKIDLELKGVGPHADTHLVENVKSLNMVIFAENGSGKSFISKSFKRISERKALDESNVEAVNVNDEDNSIDINLAIDTSRFFQLDRNEAKNLAEKICLIVRESWEGAARRYGLSRGQIEIMRPAFEASNWGK